MTAEIPLKTRRFARQLYECPHCDSVHRSISDFDVVEQTEKGTDIRECPECGLELKIQ